VNTKKNLCLNISPRDPTRFDICKELRALLALWDWSVPIAQRAQRKTREQQRAIEKDDGIFAGV